MLVRYKLVPLSGGRSVAQKQGVHIDQEGSVNHTLTTIVDFPADPATARACPTSFASVSPKALILVGIHGKGPSLKHSAAIFGKLLRR